MNICQTCGNETKNKRFCKRSCYKGVHLGGQGGYRKGSGRSRSGYYKGFHCDSTYELAYLIYHIDHGLQIERNKNGYEYEYKGKLHTYYPDFITEQGLIEIKGMHTDLVDIKASAVSDKLTILYKEDLQNIFNYVFDNYLVNKNTLHTLYDNHKPKYKYQCSNCDIIFTTEQIRKKTEKFCSRKCAGQHRAKIKHMSLSSNG